MYSSPVSLWVLPVSLGGVLVLVAAGQLFRYMRNITSANIYETGVVYDYPGDFDEEEHTHFGSGSDPEEELLEQERGEGRPRGVQVGTNKRSEVDILRHFVRNEIIPYFQEQRHPAHGGNHFAVLVLLEDSLSSLSADWTFKPLTDTGTPHVDSHYSTRPPRNMYNNYIVARPQLHKVNPFLRRMLRLFYDRVPEIFYEHAELMLLNEFDTLCEMFEAHCGSKAKVIILFSWLFPCDRCTSHLVQKFGRDFRANCPDVQRVVLVFAVYWVRMPFEENWKNFERLTESGFDVVRLHTKRQ